MIDDTGIGTIGRHMKIFEKATRSIVAEASVEDALSGSFI